MHAGRNISKIRELLNIKQESLALKLKISQQTISKIEQTENLSDNTLERIANALGIKKSMILNYNEQIIIECLNGIVKSPELNFEMQFNDHHLILKIFELYERLILAEKEKFHQCSNRF
jgi:transcriptional regulator with XRE-family HTH domain